ncbi:restriction endonuclease subunit S [Streptosporangium sp. CA-115845]|uniref:restriction endonuclease subunit S n=1 Tax=Streptosporangium sp. CA-115845 TaxID=3240071 RepID=UPI003D8A3C4F
MNAYPEVTLGTFLWQESDIVSIDPDATYTTAGIYSYGRGLFKRPPITGSETNYLKYNRIRKGQFIYSKLFGWEGALATVPEEFDGLHVSHEFPTFHIDDAVADPDYVAHLTTWPGLHDKLRDQGTGMGSRRQRVNIDRLLSTTVPLPKLDEQRRIAAHLDAATAKIGKIRQLKETAEATRRALFSSLITRAGDPAQVRDFLIPVNDSVPVEADTLYRTAGIYSHGRGMFTRPPIKGSETKYARYNRLRAGQFVYSKLFGWEGALAIVPDEFDRLYVSHEFPTFAIDADVADPRYVKHLVTWPALHAALRDKTTGMGSRRQRVSPERLLATEVPLPPMPEQRRLADALDSLATCHAASATQDRELKALGSALLNYAFNGRL